MINILATDSAVEIDYESSDTTLDFGSFVSPTGTDFVLIVATLTSDEGGEIINVEYGGLTFFEAASGLQSGGSATVMYYALNPSGDSITDSPVVNYKSATLTRKGAIYALSGVDQDTPINTTVQDNFDIAEGKELSITPSVNNCLLIDCVGTKEQSGYGLTNSETEVLFDESVNSPDGNPSVAGSQYYQQTTAALKTLSWGWSGETYYNYSIIAVQPAPEPVTGSFFNYFYS
jgi:hypothetical protein